MFSSLSVISDVCNGAGRLFFYLYPLIFDEGLNSKRQLLNLLVVADLLNHLTLTCYLFRAIWHIRPPH